MMEYINVIIDEMKDDDVSEEEEESTTPEQHITPDVTDGGINIIISPEDDNSEGVRIMFLEKKGH